MHSSRPVDLNEIVPIEFWRSKINQVELCTGEKIDIELAEEKIIFSYNGSRVEVPRVSPFSKKRAVDIFHDLCNTLIVWYESSWPELQESTCAAGVVLLKNNKLVQLENVKPETFVWPEEDITSQLIISRVEDSPFGVPCAASLDTADLNSDPKTPYVFPKEEPLIIEGITSFHGRRRIHDACNLPGTGADYGGVPFLYPWISPDKKRHGWALALYKDWEIIGKKRPHKKELETKKSECVFLAVDGQKYIHRESDDIPKTITDRCINYDPCGEEEWYEFLLGEKLIEFRALEKWKNSNLFYIGRQNLKVAVWEHRDEYRKKHKIKSKQGWGCSIIPRPTPCTLELVEVDPKFIGSSLKLPPNLKLVTKHEKRINPK